MKKILLLTVALIGFGAMSIAQDLKFAHVKSDSVLTNVESYKAIVAEQEDIDAKYQKRADKIQRDIIRIQNEADSLNSIAPLSDVDLELYSSDLQKKQQDLQVIEYKRQEQLMILGERMEKLMVMYRKAVGKVAAAQGITYVFDETQQLLYAGPQSQDVTEEVKAEIIKMDTDNPVHRFP